MNGRVMKLAAVITGLLIGFAGGLLVSQVYETYDPYWAPLGGHLTTMAGGSGIVVFVSDRTGSPEIWCVRSDGAFATQLTFTNDGQWKYDPDVSIDGRWIVYTSDPDVDGYLDVFVMAIDGTHLTQVTSALADERSYGHAAWHPSCRAILVEDWITDRIFIMEVDDPPYMGAGEPRLVETAADDGNYVDVLGSVGSGGMLVFDGQRTEFWEASALKIDERSNAWIYVRGDACYQCGIANSCGLANFPVTVALSSNPSEHFLIETSPQYVDPVFFEGSWTGLTGHLQFALGDTYYDDNCGSYTIWVIPSPRWGNTE